MDCLCVKIRSVFALELFLLNGLDVYHWGFPQYYMRDFNVAELAEDVVNELKLNFRKHNIELRLKIPKEQYIVHQDKTKLKQVLRANAQLEIHS